MQIACADVPVRMALGEAHVLALTKRALSAAGVSVDALEEAAAASGTAAASKSIARSATALLVKNLPYSATEAELQVTPALLCSQWGRKNTPTPVLHVAREHELSGKHGVRWYEPLIAVRHEAGTGKHHGEEQIAQSRGAHVCAQGAGRAKHNGRNRG